jgi:hypothetical protein
MKERNDLVDLGTDEMIMSERILEHNLKTAPLLETTTAVFVE